MALPEGTCTQAGDEEAGRAVDVRQRLQELRALRVAERRPLVRERRVDARGPQASTTASDSSALTVQTE